MTTFLLERKGYRLAAEVHKRRFRLASAILASNGAFSRPFTFAFLLVVQSLQARSSFVMMMTVSEQGLLVKWLVYRFDRLLDLYHRLRFQLEGLGRQN